MTNTTPSEDFIELDFVYCGLIFSNNEFSVIVAPINPNGSLQKECFYKYKKGRDRTIGGIYRGAAFSEKSCRNIDSVTYVDTYKDAEAIIRWKARNDQAKTQERTYKLEKDAKKTNEMDAMLMTARKLYSNYRKRNDFAGMEAIEAAVLRSLRTPIRQSETDR